MGGSSYMNLYQNDIAARLKDFITLGAYMREMGWGENMGLAQG